MSTSPSDTTGRLVQNFTTNLTFGSFLVSVGQTAPTATLQGTIADVVNNYDETITPTIVFTVRYEEVDPNDLVTGLRARERSALQVSITTVAGQIQVTSLASNNVILWSPVNVCKPPRALGSCRSRVAYAALFACSRGVHLQIPLRGGRRALD
jgi:hypothetical protein